VPAPVPPTIGKYQVLERLAVGGMAELFKAKVRGDHGFEKLVAIKKILPHLAADPQFVAMFIDEARITAQLDHPNIVQVYELGTDADTPYIAMQYVDGIDVLGLLRECARTQRRLPPELSAMIVRDTLDALDYAHTASDAAGHPLSIVHRDVSPGNVLVSRRGDVKLTDFGILWAVERKHKTEAGVLKGKYGYMSPEQVLGVDLDGRSDLFSVGTLLAEMVMMRRLFTAPNELDILLMVRDARLDRLDKHAEDFPLELRVICEKALQRWPEDRWPNAGSFRDALSDWLIRNGRPTARDLSDFLAALVDAPTVAAPVGGIEPPVTLSGPSTRIAAAEAREAAAAGRRRYLAAAFASSAIPDLIADEDSSSGIVITGEESPSGGVAPGIGGPTQSGDLRHEAPIRVIHRFARDKANGLIVLEGRAGILKEAFFADGHPQFVSSNVQSERLGDFLVAQGAITPQQLARAVAAMPDFQNRLADTLVGLGLLRPLEAFRLLARQVGAKLSEACTWQKGRWRFYPGRKPPNARPLHLDAWKILGAGAMMLDLVFVEDWASSHAADVIDQTPGSELRGIELDRFGLGEVPTRVHALLAGGRATVGELVQRVRSPEARGNFLRIVYLLVQCELAALR
jgi:serine/threonine-protein kinase